MALIPDNHIYHSLIGLANYFKNEDPPDIKACIHCLQTLLSTNQPLQIEIKIYIQLSQILLENTYNYDHAKFYIEKAVR